MTLTKDEIKGQLARVSGYGRDWVGIEERKFAALCELALDGMEKQARNEKLMAALVSIANTTRDIQTWKLAGEALQNTAP